MKKILPLIVLTVITSQTFALDRTEVKSILNLVAISANSTERVVNVQSARNPLVNIGQVYDLVETTHDFELNRIQVVYHPIDISTDTTNTALANCESLVRLDSKSKIATVDVRKCKDAMTGEDVRLHIESLANEQMTLKDGELILSGDLRSVDASDVINHNGQITDFASAFEVTMRAFKKNVIKPIRNGLFQ